MAIVFFKLTLTSVSFLFFFLIINRCYKLIRAKHLLETQKKRDEYKKLWKLSSILPLQSTESFMWSNNVHATCNELRNWYLNGGALLLSRNSREMYSVIQDELNEQAKLFSNNKLNTINYYYIKSLFRIFNKELKNEMVIRSKQLFK